MIEYPEAHTYAKDFNEVIINKEIANIIAFQSDHKFTFTNETLQDNIKNVIGHKIDKVIARGFYLEFYAGDYRFLFREGTNVRYIEYYDELPKKHQLLIHFTDNTYLVCTVAMYGSIELSNINEALGEYYEKELAGTDLLSDAFSFSYFQNLIDDDTKKLSAKAFLATGQRFIGIGNGTVQDILFNARIHPKTKLNLLTDIEIKALYQSVINTISQMTLQGGRNTERNLYGIYGSYQTILSKNTYKKPCPVCSGQIIKAAYLGGNIYYCETCQQHKK